MPSVKRRTRGFTLIELMVVVTVILVVGLLALPSFNSFRQRAALRAATEQVVSFWNQARFEAAKRNQMVKVGVMTHADGHYCLGAATTTDPADETPCDCFTANACNVAGFPAPPVANFDTQSEWGGVTFLIDAGVTPTLGGVDEMVAVIEPKRGGLTEAGDVGALTFAAPSGSRDYKVNFIVDQFGRANLCGSNLAAHDMSDHLGRECAP